MGGWKAYGELAWLEPVIAPPQDFVEESTVFCRAIRENAQFEVNTLLHLACGAGINDYTFKKHFAVTGVDISEGMLNVARELNPEVSYIHGDMRSVRLGRLFDAVAIPDSIGYMQTVEELRRVLITVNEHLRPGGVLLIVANIAEHFQSNNFIYSRTKGDLDVTIFENNYWPAGSSTYEAVLVYLVRRGSSLEIHTDKHVLGVFRLQAWLELFGEFGFEVKQTSVGRFYDHFVQGDGDYPLYIFVCTKPA